VIGLMDSTGNIPAEYGYSPFGVLTSQSYDNVGNALRYGAREYDAETGFYYQRARYYDPSVGRFLSADPAGGSVPGNPYAYANNHPINNTDPSGLDPCTPALIALGFTTNADSRANGGAWCVPPAMLPPMVVQASGPDYLDLAWGAQPFGIAEPFDVHASPDGGGGSVSAKSSDARDNARLTRYNACIGDTPGSYTMAALSILPLGNMKLAQGFRLPGSSAFTSIDRRFPWLPFANSEGGVAVRVVGSGTVKTAGTLGTIGAVVGTFATSYALTTIARCAIGSW